MTTPITLYMDPMSQPSRAVWMFCLENNLPIKIEHRMVHKGQPRSSEFRKLNPNGQVPVIDDNGTIVWESHTIMRYLSAKYSDRVADHWYPRGSTLDSILHRARIDQYLDWHHSWLRRGAAGCVFNLFVAPLVGLTSSAEETRVRLTDAKTTLNTALKRMDRYFLSGDARRPFLMGMAQPSIADLAAACELVMLALLASVDPDLDWGQDAQTTKYKNVAAWLNGVKTIGSWKEVHLVLEKVVAKRRKEAAASQQLRQINTNATNASSSSISGSAWSRRAQSFQSSRIMSAIQSQLASPMGAEVIRKLQAKFKFIIKPSPAQTQQGMNDPIQFILDLKTPPGTVKEPSSNDDREKVDTTFTLTDDNFVAMAMGKLNPQVAFLSGKLKLGGNLPKAMSFNANILQNAAMKEKIASETKNIVGLTSKL